MNLIIETLSNIRHVVDTYQDLHKNSYLTATDTNNMDPTQHYEVLI